MDIKRLAAMFGAVAVGPNDLFRVGLYQAAASIIKNMCGSLFAGTQEIELILKMYEHRHRDHMQDEDGKELYELLDDLDLRDKIQASSYQLSALRKFMDSYGEPPEDDQEQQELVEMCNEVLVEYEKKIADLAEKVGEHYAAQESGDV